MAYDRFKKVRNKMKDLQKQLKTKSEILAEYKNNVEKAFIEKSLAFKALNDNKCTKTLNDYVYCIDTLDAAKADYIEWVGLLYY